MFVPVWERKKMVEENLYPTDEMENFFTTLIEEMQTDLSDEGFQVPSLTTAEITQIAGDPNVPNGRIWYDTDVDEYKGKKGGVVVTFQTI